MARPRESTPNSVSDAVRQLRQELSLTQQEFANSLGVAITTVARWETTRPPRGAALSVLLRFANDHKAFGLGKIFFAAMVEDLKLQAEWGEILAKRVLTGIYMDLLALRDMLERGAGTDKEKINEAISTLGQVIARIDESTIGAPLRTEAEQPVEETK